MPSRVLSTTYARILKGSVTANGTLDRVSQRRPYYRKVYIGTKRSWIKVHGRHHTVEEHTTDSSYPIYWWVISREPTAIQASEIMDYLTEFFLHPPTHERNPRCVPKTSTR